MTGAVSAPSTDGASGFPRLVLTSVPYPFAANNHQEFNARFLTAAGAGEIILNKDFTGEAFAGKINHHMIPIVKT